LLTPYPEIDGLLEALVAGARMLLGARFVGAYLDGSLAAGDFDPATSDIDVVVVTGGDLSPDLIAALRAMHVGLAGRSSRWVSELEVAYVARDVLERAARRPRPCPCLERGSARLELVWPESGYWTIHRHVLREHGIALAGPPPATLIAPVRPDALRQAVADILQEWWRPMLDEPSRLRSWGYRCYAVLTMCRMLYTLHHGTIVSKPVAARWARATLDRRWSPLVDDALAWSAHAPPDLNDSLALIRATYEQSRWRRRGRLSPGSSPSRRSGCGRGRTRRDRPGS
jgi:predicted nucleotidyltransferase